jgi:hypothetical protein
MSLQEKPLISNAVLNLLKSHNMRKLFNSAMLNAGAYSFHVEFFIGSGKLDTHVAYFKASHAKLTDIGINYVLHLTIKKKLDI